MWNLDNKRLCHVFCTMVYMYIGMYISKYEFSFQVLPARFILLFVRCNILSIKIPPQYQDYVSVNLVYSF